MSPANEQSKPLDARMHKALEEYLERTDRGEDVDPELFVANYPEIADDLRSFIFDSTDLARRAAVDSVRSDKSSTNPSLCETIAPMSPGGAPELPEVFGRYRLQRMLGRGAMGVVYLAKDTQLSRLVAIKIPSFSGDQSGEVLQRFYIEARAAATLRSPHICPVYDVGEIEGWHYISMAYIDGHSLADVIKVNGRQPERQVLILIRKLALALQDAHNQGIIHRDLKPGNVMLDTRGEPVVMDFGLACQIQEGSERITLSGVILGSPAYMPPEQIEGNSRNITHAADQYSLGVILYELLTGELPFRGSIPAVISQIVIKPAPSPRLLRSDLDPRVDVLCLRMLSKTAAERLDSMKAVADQIASILKEPPAKVRDATSDAGTQTELSAKIPSVMDQSAQNTGRPKTVRPNTTSSMKSAPTKPTAPAANTPAQVDAVDSGAHSRDITTLCLLAGKFIRKHDYDQACRILSSVPSDLRTNELNDLLNDAEEKSEEARLLLKDIELAIRKDQAKELPGLVRRFLQLKPGNKAMQLLAKELQEFGAERAIQMRRGRGKYFDPAGSLWNPLHIAGFVVGLTLLCLVVYLRSLAMQTPHDDVIVRVTEPTKDGRLSNGKSNGNDADNAASEGWEDLLAAVDTNSEYNKLSHWKREGNSVVGTLPEGKPLGWVAFKFPQKITEDYDLEIDYRLDNCRYLMVSIPLTDTIVRVAFSQAGAGLYWIDGQDGHGVNVPPPHGNPDLQTQSGVVQHFVVSVRHLGEDVVVETKLDGVSAGRFAGPRSRLYPLQTKHMEGDRCSLTTLFNDKSPGQKLVLQKARIRRLKSPATEPGITPMHWTYLFNGDDLTGWEGDRAFWSVNEGVLASKSAALNNPVYLLSDQKYENFELRLQFRLLNEGHAGIQYRSSLNAAGTESPLSGRLVEIGYDESRGQASQNVTCNISEQGPQRRPITTAQGAQRQITDRIYRRQEWNDLVIRCQGPHEIVELNGLKTAEANQVSVPQSGRIGIQLLNKAEIEFRAIRVRPLAATTTTPSTAPIASKNSGKVFLDVDFRKTNGGFFQGDNEHILSEYKIGEYRQLCKKRGDWFEGIHPAFFLKENNQLQDFALEMDVRIVGKNKGRFAVRFGRIGNVRLDLCLSQTGEISLGRQNEADIVPPKRSPAMRPVDQFNTLRLEVVKKTVRVTVNGSLLFEKPLDRYAGREVVLFMLAEDVPFDVRLQRIRFERLGDAEPRFLTQEVRRLKGHTEMIRGVEFLPDSQRAVSVGHGKAFKLWDVTNGRLLHEFVGHTHHVSCVSVSGDGKHALTGCDDGLVRLWDLGERTLLKTLKGHTSEVRSVLLSKDGQIGLSSSNDGTIRRWNLESGASTNLPGPANRPHLAISRTESVVAAGNEDGTLFLRSIQGMTQLVGHGPGAIEGLAFTPDGTKLVTAADEGTVRIWDPDKLKEIRRLETNGVGFCNIAITNDGRFAMAGSRDCTIPIWDLLTGELVSKIQTDMPVTHRMALSPDNTLLLSGGGDNYWVPVGDYDLRLWKVPSPPGPAEPVDESRLTPLIDADFSKGLHGFGSFEDKTFKLGLLNHEWQYSAKMPLPAPATSRGDQPQIQGPLHSDFVFEADVRWELPPGARQNSGWQLKFGALAGVQDARLQMNSDRTISVDYYDFAKNEWAAPLPSKVVSSMRPPNEINTFRLEVEQGNARVFVNSKYAGQAKIPRYQPGTAELVLLNQEVNQDLRFRKIRLWRLNPSSP
jgi:serine/threonine protein kinase/WD40 repeat protein